MKWLASNFNRGWEGQFPTLKFTHIWLTLHIVISKLRMAIWIICYYNNRERGHSKIENLPLLPCCNMYVCMTVISSYLGAPCPTPRGDRTGTNEPHYRSGEGGSKAFTVWINVRFPLNICTGEGPAFGMRPRD